MREIINVVNGVVTNYFTTWDNSMNDTLCLDYVYNTQVTFYPHI